MFLSFLKKCNYYYYLLCRCCFNAMLFQQPIKKFYYIHDECLLFKTRFLQTYKNVRLGLLIIFCRNFVYNRDDYLGTRTLYVCGEEINYN